MSKATAHSSGPDIEIGDHRSVTIFDSTSIGINDAQSIVEAILKQNEMILKGLFHRYALLESPHYRNAPKQPTDC